MTLIWFWSLAVLGLLGVNSVPVAKEADIPLEKIEELQQQLLVVQRTLEDLNHNIDSYVEKLVQNERRNNVENPQVAAPDSDETLIDFEHQLSPDDQLLLKHMQGKVKLLQSVLHNPNQGTTNEGEEGPEVDPAVLEATKRFSIPLPDVPAEESDIELQAFQHQLSAADQELLKKMKGKLKFLQGTLHEEHHDIDPSEIEEMPEQIEQAKRFGIPLAPAPNLDKALNSFAGKLPKKDQVLLKHMKNKVKFLQGVLHEKEGNTPAEIEEEITDEEVEENKKSEVQEGPSVSNAEQDQELQDFMAGLSHEELSTLKKFKNKVNLLEGVLHEPVGQTNPGEGSEDVERRQLEQDEVSEVLQQLSPEDQQLMKQNMGKIKYLVQAMDTPVSDGEEEAEEELVDVKRFNDPTDKAVFTEADRLMLQTVKKGLDEIKQKLAELKQRQKDKKPKVKVNKKCTDEDCECRGLDCDPEKPVDSNVAKRLVSDLNSAASSGVDLKQLLQVLRQARAKRHVLTTEEEELKALVAA